MVLATILLTPAGGAAYAGSPPQQVPPGDVHAQAMPGEVSASAPLIVSGPDAAYEAEVSMQGTGCRERDAWDAQLSGDGTRLILTFSGFEAHVDQSLREHTAACSMSIKLRTQPGRSVRIESVGGQGYAYLEAGMTGRITLRGPLRGAEAQTTTVSHTGPFDGGLRFFDGPVAAPESCPSEQEYVGHVEIALARDSAGSSQGYVYLAAFDTLWPGKLELALRPVTCPAR